MNRFYISVMFLILISSISHDALSTELTKRQHHDVHHVTLSCIGTAYLNHVFELPLWKSALIVLALGITNEACDEFVHQLNIKNDYFDYREGWSNKDILRNGIGVSLSIPIRRRKR